MRSLVATLALIVSIGGLLVVIAYGATDAYLNFGDDETDLDNSLLLGTITPGEWEATSLEGVAFDEKFVAPCLQTPLLNGVSINGRGAHTYLPPGGNASGVQLLMIQTTPGDARAIMDDVGRDTENDCQRGVTVGTVERAEVDTDTVDGADRSVLVDFDQQVVDTTRRYMVLVLQQDTYIAHLSYQLNEDPVVTADDLLALGGALAARIDNPPTTADLAAAGALDEPSAMEQRAQRINDEASRLLTADGRYPVLAGMAGLGVMILVFYILGARLSRMHDMASEAPSLLSGSEAYVPVPAAPPKLTDYGVPERRWIASSGHRPGSESDREEHFGLDLPEPVYAEEVEQTPAPEPAGPPPVLDFPQKSIEEKLKILKDARLKEPRREHRPVREVTPDVDWTEEISKPQSSDTRDDAEPPTGQVSRKALLKKLRTNEDIQ